MSRVIATMHAPICPCCPHDLLRHVRATGIYWFCPHCYQEMPIIEEEEFRWLKRRKHVETIAARFIEEGKFEVVATSSNRDRQQKNSRVKGEKSKIILASTC